MSESVIAAEILEPLVARIGTLAGHDRVIIGIAGKPGAGKSTLALALVDALDDAAYLPMDGFHLADAALAERGLLDRKGAPQTFDAGGYGALLERISAGEGIWAPGFERDLEQPIAQSLWIGPDVRTVITEGNYLLLPEWQRARAQFTEAWFVQVPEEVRIRRLTWRHVHFGKTPFAAQDWVRTADEPNALIIEPTSKLADMIIDLGPS